MPWLGILTAVVFLVSTVLYSSVIFFNFFVSSMPALVPRLIFPA
jgi:hypothetical protein